MEKNAAAGRTPSSVPMPTPPPATLSSPKFAPLSPVQTNLLSEAKPINTKAEPTNFSLPPSYVDDDRAANAITPRGPFSDQSELRPHLGEQRNDRFPPGGYLISCFFFTYEHYNKKIIKIIFFL